ncbi:MAG: hypothetical protein ACX98W_10680 [bacterium]
MTDGVENRVVVTDIRMPFWSMVVFLVKLTIAAIPAYIILLAIGFMVFAILGGLGGGFDANQ